MADLRPLHVGKFVPPPYAGVEAHVDTLLRALLPEVQGTLVAAESPQLRIGDPRAPYRLLTARAYGKFASATLSPGVLGLVRTELAMRRCNLLHVHAPNPWGDLAGLRCPADIPLVMTWHSDILRQRNLMKVYRFVQQRAIARADKVVVFTPKHYESSGQLHQMDAGRKIALVPIGIDFDRLAPRFASPEIGALLKDFTRGRPTILSVGRHVYYKGYEYLLQAVARLRSEAVLVMIGSGALSAALRQQAEELGIHDRVLFLGEIDDAGLASAMHHCDLFCLPSIERTEAFGIASAEAMACGKPAVVCELGNGVNYLNQAGKTGLTVPPRDARALADALDTLVADRGLRERMGNFARDWVRSEFSVSAMKRAMISLYESLV